MLLLQLFNFSAFQSKINPVYFIHLVIVLLSHSCTVRVYTLLELGYDLPQSEKTLVFLVGAV